jgi:hypothetical protein
MNGRTNLKYHFLFFLSNDNNTRAHDQYDSDTFIYDTTKLNKVKNFNYSKRSHKRYSCIAAPKRTGHISRK